MSVNHPFQTCSKCDWGLNWEHNDAIEVWNGQWDSTDQMAVDEWHKQLVAGRKVAAIGGSDAHHPPDLVGLPTTVVRSRGKSQGAIVDAAKRGHAYLVREKQMSLNLVAKVAAQSYGIGDRVNAAGNR